MSINKSLTLLAGAVALALSAGANAATTTTSIILNVVDTSNMNSFVFDTALPVTGADPGSYSTNLSTNAAYQSFLGAETSASDTLEYSVVGYSNTPGVETTAANAPGSTVSGTKINQAAINLSQFLSQVNNPSAGASFLPASTTPAAAQYAVDTDPSFSANAAVTDLNLVGTAENFWALTATNPSASRGGFTTTELSSQWNFTSAGLLTYGSSVTPPPPVPLPAPVVLLLSGLGLMGVVARRRQVTTV